MRITPLEFNQKKLSLTGFLLILSLVLGFPAFAQDIHNLEKVKTQIHILNLLNGLELNKEQMQLVLDAAKQAEVIRNKTKEWLLRKEDEINQVYNEVLRVAKTGSLSIREDIAFRVHKVNQEVDKIKEAAQEELTALAIGVKNNLASYQLYVLDDYKPCIIPPVKQGRIGQADNPIGFAKILERVHSMPQNSYNLKKEEIAKKAIDRMKVKVPPGFIIEEEKLKTQLLKTMDEARAMSDVDFVLRKEELAKNINAQLLPEKPPINIGIKIERFLLQPDIIPILEQRLTQYPS
jgi:hypothetical protein